MNDEAPRWVIVGGESGRGARSMELDWARLLRDHSTILGRVFNFKQVGGSDSGKGGHTLGGKVHFDRPHVWERSYGVAA